MPVAVAGVTTNFTLSAVTPTQVALSNSGRTYGLLVNLDPVNGVWFGFGTNNTVTKNGGHYLGPRRYFEMVAGRVVQGDLSCIADASVAAQPPISLTNVISWVEE